VMSGAPVVPVYVSGSGAALPRGRALPRLARVRVTFGPPLTFKMAGTMPGTIPGTIPGQTPGRLPGKRADDEGRKEAYREAAQGMRRAIAQLREQQVKS